MTVAARARPAPPTLRPATSSAARFPARPAEADWPATGQDRQTVLARLTAPPFARSHSVSQSARRSGLSLLLDWLEDQPGNTWQQRWLATGADRAGLAWRQETARWLRGRGQGSQWQHDAMAAAIVPAICADIIRPALTWFTGGATAHGPLALIMAAARDPAGFAALAAACGADPGVSPAVSRLAVYRAAVICGARGGSLPDITVGDVLELLDAETSTHAGRGVGAAVFYQKLHQLGILDAHAPPALRELRVRGQRPVEELVDRYQITCRPVRDLLVDYLRERQPALDYTSLRSLAYHLAGVFWSDIERHHRGIDSLRLPPDVAGAWKQRLQTKTTTITTLAGETTTTTAERLNYRECLTPVRAFYLDLACWAIEDPARWAQWVAPCPIGDEEVSRRKSQRRRKARMDARTRERLPVLPALVRTTSQRCHDAVAILAAARDATPGHAFTAAGQTLARSATPHAAAAAGKIWAEDPATGRRRDLTLEEDHAFWTWAIIEVLRATGVRIEELLELSHHSLVQYRLPGTGELVPLLQIAPSKTDAERLLVVSPELADVLAAIISRIREPGGAVPLVRAYDRHECAWATPAPLLFQRRHGTNRRAITDWTARKILARALAGTGLTDPATGRPLRYTPHDFRRMFITDAILNGLPPHIAQVIAGHRDINVTLGYKAVYPEQAIQAHLAFLARRRALRPTDEYRVPTDEEWTEFLGHCERRKVATGICGRAFGTPCIHEHSCLRCALHWPDPAQRTRIAEIRDNLIARIAEADREGWLGEVEGLKVSLAGAQEKLAQIDRRRHHPVDLGVPAVGPPATRPN
jgi:hypothetical protein